MHIAQIYGSNKIARNIYARKTFAEFEYETGFAEYGTIYVPVWRKLRPDGSPMMSDDRIDGYVWQNIYVPTMHRNTRYDHIVPAYKTEQKGTINFTVPTMTLEYSRSFLSHLEKIKQP